MVMNGDETAVVPNDVQTAAVGLAWSGEEPEGCEPDPHPQRRSWSATCASAAALIISAAALAAAVGFVGLRSHQVHEAPPVTSVTHPHAVALKPAPVPHRPSAAPKTAPKATPKAAPKTAPKALRPAAHNARHLAPPRPRRRVVAPAPLAASRGFPPADDQRVLQDLRSLGYTITDPSLVISNAHEACRLFQLGESPRQVNQQMSKRMGADLTDTLQLTSSAMLAYPTCY